MDEEERRKRQNERAKKCRARKKLKEEGKEVPEELLPKKAGSNVSNLSAEAQKRRDAWASKVALWH